VGALRLVFGVVTRAAGPPAALRAAPPFVAVLLFSAVVFGGNGMRPRDLCAAAAASPALRAALWGAWILLTAPAARTLLETPSTFFLRALPVAPRVTWAVHGAHLLVLQAPWAVLFGVGAGPLAGVAGAFAGAAAAALWVARPAAPGEIAAAALLVATLAAGAPPALLLPVAAASGAAGVAAAWRRAPERSARAGASLVAGQAPAALVLAHVAVIVRRDRMALIRGGLVALVGGVVLALSLRNNAVQDEATRETVTLVAGGIPLALATGGVAMKVLETERGLAWLLLTTAASARLRALAAAGVSVAWGAVAGTIYGVAAALVSGEGVELALLGHGLGAALGGVAAFAARRADQPSGVDGTAVTVGMFAAAAGVMAISAGIGPAAIGLIALAAAALVGATPRLLLQHERRTEIVLHVPWGGP
jgi:hypothetical protein